MAESLTRNRLGLDRAARTWIHALAAEEAAGRIAPERATGWSHCVAILETLKHTRSRPALPVLTVSGFSLLALSASTIHAAADAPPLLSNTAGQVATAPVEFDAVARQVREGRYTDALVALQRLPTPSSAMLFRSLMLKADIALRQRKPEQAHQIYIQAEGQSEESPDADIGQVRADLLAGEFRRASAFALLVSGEHADSAEALAIGAFLEERAGQTERALDFLDKARARAPDSVALLGAFAEILIDRGRAVQATETLDAWIRVHRVQPDIYALRARASAATGDRAAAQLWRARTARAYAQMGETARARTLYSDLGTAVDESKEKLVTGDREPDGNWPAPYFEPFPDVDGHSGNGFVIDDGSRVVTLSALVSGARGGIYVRNGIGQLRKARVDAIDADSGLATLRLDAPYETRWSLSRDQFGAAVPGRQASVVGFGVVDRHEATWPVVTPGFAIRPQGKGPLKLSSDLPESAAGSAVFDPQGHLVGIVARAHDGSALKSDPIAIPATALQPLLHAPPASPASPASPATPATLATLATSVSAKELLERVQGAVVVVLVPD